MLKQLQLLLVSLVIGISAFSQTITSSTYNLGAQEIEREFIGVDTSSESICVDTLLVSITPGNYVYSIDVSYDLQAFGNVWTADLASYLESVSTNSKENAIVTGVGNTAGTQSYSRTNLQIATGTTASGQLEFVLHAFRTFNGFGCNTTNALVVDSTFTVTVHHGPPPTCFPPLAPAVVWTMSNKAQVSWTTGGASNWQIEYGAPGFSPGSGTLINAPSNPFTISGLSANTDYDFIVRDSCGLGDVSLWSLPGSFSTICAPSISPFTENFDGTSWVQGTGFPNAGDSINSCWERNPNNNGGFFWGTGSGATSTGNTGPSADNTTGSGNYIYTEASNGGYQSIATITSPLVDLGALTTPEIEFHYHMFGASMGQMSVEIWSQSTGWSTVLTKSGQQQDSSDQAWIKESVTLSNYVDDTVRVRFRGIRSFNNTGDMAIDDVKFQEAPSCPKPSNLAVNLVSPISVTLNWTDAGATSWDVVYGPPGFTQGNGTLSNVTSHPTIVSGLSPGTTYEFYVREHCSATDTSDWIGPVTATTLCVPISAPYAEDFDGSSWVPGTGVYNGGDTLAPCWIRAPGAGSTSGDPYYWGARSAAPTTFGTGPASDNSGTGNFVYTESSAGTPGQAAALSAPYMSLTPLTNPELRFWYHMYGGGMGTLSVDVYSASTGINLGVFVISGQQQNTPNAAWTEAIVSLSSYANDTVLIVFRGLRGTNNNSDIAIDDVTVDEAPTCPDPTNFAAANVTSNSVDLSWTTGGASNWNIASGAPGFTPGSTFASATTNPFTLTGLTPGTSYDLYVRDSCAVGDVSQWVGPISIFTLCAPVAAPYVENFDDTLWAEGPNQSPGQINPCWLRSDTTGYWWKAGTGTTPTNNTGPNGDNTSGTGGYIFTESNGGSGNTTIYSPLVDLSALTTPELTFYYHMYGALINKLDVEVNDGSGWSVESTITGQQQANSAAAWNKEIVSLASYASDTIQVRFVATRNPGFNNQADISIDDFDVHEAPSCPQPDSLAVTATTATSITLSWATGGATAWQIEYGPVGFLPGAGTLINAVTNPFTVTGLSGSTSYDFYVRDSCGVGNTSLWEGPITDNTLCVVASAPYIETFDFGFDEGTGQQNTGSTIGACWTRNPATGYHWGGGTGTTPSGGTGPTADHTSGTGNYVYTEASGGGGGGGGTPPEAELESPEIEMSALTNPMLTFWYHINGNAIGDFDVEVYDGSTWNSELTIGTSQGNQWLEANIMLTTYASDTIKVRFTSTRGTGFQAFSGDIAVDDFSIDEAPSCPKPDSLTVISTGQNSVTLGWLTGGAANWHIEYGPPGFIQGAGTIVAATTNPFTVTGLTPTTDYDFYVRDSCGVADVSDWIGPVTGTTLCGVFSAPFTENFDGSTWLVGNGGFAAGTIDDCWVRSANGQYWFKPGQGATPTQQTGPSGDHTSGSGKYIYTESFNGSTNTNIASPLIDLDTLSNPELRFWYHMYGSLINDLTIEVNNGSGWTPVDTIVGQQQTSQTAAWLENTIDLTSYVGDTIQIRFVGDKTAGNQNRADISIDDFVIDNAPTCIKPTLLSSTASTTTSVTLAWTTGGAANWQIEYGPVGFANGAGTIVSATSNPFIVTGLSPAQSYDFYVRDSCGIGEVSFWEGPITEQTACGIVLAPYFENFDLDFDEGTGAGNDGSTISPCWTRDVDSAYHWGGGTGGTTTFGTGPNADHTSGFGNYVYTEASFAPNGSVALLESPSINLTPLNSPELHFWYHMWANNGTMGTLTWEIFSNNTWTVLDSLSGDQGNAWQEIVMDLSSYANQTVKLRFKGQKSSGATPQQGDIAIDDLSIVEAPTCPDPTGLVATTQTNTSIQLGWTTGGATSWQIEYGPTGFTPGSGTIINTSSNPHVVTGLTQGACYDFYVRDSCGLNDYSAWIGPVNACTFNCISGCGYTLRLTDNFGDGWIGNNPGTISHSLSVTIGTTVTSYTMVDGFDSIIPLNVCDGDTILMSFVINGNWSNECGVILRDANNVVLYQDTAMSGGLIYNGSASCNNPCPTPVAAFTETTNGLSVDFDGTSSTGTSLTYAWDFGDGTNGTTPNPNHVYGQDGIYNVQLIITDICGQSDTIMQTITVCGPLSANFIWSQNGLSVTLDASAITNATSFNWLFGDGSSDTGSVVTHPFATTGTYAVNLTVTNLCGQTADTTIIITVCVKPTASWNYNIISSGSGGMVVQFDGTGSSNTNNYNWTFGDGGTNNVSAIPVHTYSVPGLFYVVTLIVTNNCGDADTMTASLAQIGITEYTDSDILLYPNPASSIATLQIPALLISKDMLVEVVDLKGAVLLSLNKQGEESIDLSVQDLPAGTYIVRLKFEDMILQKKLMINR